MFSTGTFGKILVQIFDCEEGLANRRVRMWTKMGLIRASGHKNCGVTQWGLYRTTDVRFACICWKLVAAGIEATFVRKHVGKIREALEQAKDENIEFVFGKDIVLKIKTTPMDQIRAIAETLEA